MANKTRRARTLSVYVETVPGLEEVAWIEVRRRFPKARFSELLFARDERGIALFDVTAAPDDLFKLRTIESVFLTGAFLSKTTRGYRDLHRLREELVSSGDFGGAVNSFVRYRRRQPNSYRLLVRTYGKHEYNRQDVRRAVVQAVDQLYPQWERVQDDPDLEIWANVLGSSILLGLRLPPPSGWPPPAPAGALPGSVAEALVLLSEPRPDDIFLDPFSSGAARVRSAQPARLVLDGFQSPPVRPPTNRNNDNAAPLARVQVDAAHLPLAAGAVNKIVTRFPPSPADQITRQYNEWLLELQRVLRPGGDAVVLTRAFEQFKNAIRQTPRLEIRSGFSVTVSGEWGRIYLLQRRS